MAISINYIKDTLAKRFSTLFYFYRFLRYRMFFLLLFNFCMVILDSVGITMFVPLLQIADGNSHELTGGNKKLFDAVEAVFNFMHIDVSVVNMLLMIACVFVLKAFFVFFTLKYQVQSLQHIAKSIRINLSLGLNNLSYKEFVTTDIGRIQNSLTGEAYAVATACSQYLETIKNSMIVVVYLAFAFFLDWRFSILVILGGILTNFVYRRFYVRTKAYSREITQNNHSFAKLVIENTNHFKYLKASGRNKIYTQRMIEQLRILIDNKIKVGILGAKLQSLREPMMILIICAVIALQISVFKSTLSSVLIILVLFYRAMAYIMSLQSNWNSYLSSIGSLENIQNFEKFLNDNKEPKSGSKIVESIQTINLSGINVYYGEFKALDNITLTIQQNQSVAFVGESGAGKTTLVNMICSLLHYDSGTFLVNGTNFREIKRSSYRKKIGYITQEPTIFNADIFDNVSFWDSRSPENLERFWKVVEMCSLKKFVLHLPLQEKEMLGNNGINVSGGQKQRISIARELYRNVDLLIMDEATSALDSETEKEIKDSIESLQGKVTIISIAHRLSTVRNADILYVMDQGKIIAQGTFDDLKISSLYFKKLAELQGL